MILIKPCLSGASNAEKEKNGVVMHYQFIIWNGQHKLLYIVVVEQTPT